jgi:hypothetical protein
MRVVRASERIYPLWREGAATRWTAQPRDKVTVQL